MDRKTILEENLQQSKNELESQALRMTKLLERMKISKNNKGKVEASKRIVEKGIKDKNNVIVQLQHERNK